MKKCRFSLVLLLVLLLAACSDPEAPEGYLPNRFDSEGNAWLNLQLVFGDYAATRATTFSAGAGGEEQVEDITLVLFHKGGSDGKEDNLTVASVYTLDAGGMTSASDQVENRKEVVHSINRVRLDDYDDVYLLVLVNARALGVLTQTTEQIAAHTATLHSVSDGSTVGMTDLKFSALKTKITDKLWGEVSGKTRFLMANAPVSSSPGGISAPATGAVTTLVKIEASRIFPTEEQAKKSPAAQVYLERAAAKVSVQPCTVTQIAENPKLAIKEVAVAIDRYNDKAYLLRHYSDKFSQIASTDAKNAADKYRFVEQQAIGLATGVSGPVSYRTYWAEDANYIDYSGLKDYDVFQPLGATDPIDFYVAENTFDVDHQSLDCSTQLLVRIKLSDDTFYSIETTGEEATILPPDPFIELGTSPSESFARRRASGSDKSLAPYLRNWVMQELPAAKAWVDTYAGGDPNYLEFDVSAPDANSYVTVSVSQTAYAATTAEGYKQFQTTPGSLTIGGISYDIGTDKTLQAYIDAELTKLKIREYKNGYCYYRVPIRHFSDNQTPWTLQKDMTNGKVETIYYLKKKDETISTDDRAKATNLYLGRYGIVRNNWYSLTITAVNSLGSPTPAKVYDEDPDNKGKNISSFTPLADDAPDQFISLKMSILPWTVHGAQTIE